jgi:SNF2 family DNA or RNA helicase
MTQPFILRRLKTDATIIPDLPDKIETKEYCFLTKEQISLYEACLQSSMHDIENTEGIERKGRILTLLLHLKQICNHPAHFLKENTSPTASSSSSSSKINDIGRSGKIKRLWELLQEVMEENEKVLLFTQYREMGWILQSILETQYPGQHCFFHGSLSRKQRDELIQKFQEESKMRIMVLSLKAGGTGLNLTAANHVFHVDRWWNPAVENQATDRVFRIGQQKNVHVHKMICKGTMEESIDQLMESKLEIADKIISDTSSQLTEMSLQQLKSLFSLRKDALYE